MNIEYLRTAKKSYMIVKDADYTYENYELQMILKNDIPSLLKFQIIVGDGAVEYWYDVTGMQSMGRQFSLKPVNARQIRKLLVGLIDMKYDMEMYLLDDRNIAFLPDMIYYDRFLGRIRFCFIPGLGGQSGYEMKHLFEELLQHLDHRDSRAVAAGYDMYERCAEAEFTVEDCREFLRKYDREQEKETQMEEILAAKSKGSLLDESFEGETEEKDLQEIMVNTRLPEPKRFRRPARKKRKKKRVMNYRHYLSEEQDISCVAEEMRDMPYDGLQTGHTQYFAPDALMDFWELIYRGDGLEHDLPMTSFPFFVGTDSAQVQGVLQSRTVSRVHAKFSLEDNKLLLEDYNSTNGTYLNHRLLPMNTPTEVQPGDRIVLATEEYQVSCRKIPK